MKSEATPLQYAVLAGHGAAVDLLQTVLREKLPHLDPVWFSTARTARPLKSILFNLISRPMWRAMPPSTGTRTTGSSAATVRVRDGPRQRGARAAGARRGQHQARARDRSLARPPLRAAGVHGGAAEHEEYGGGVTRYKE